MKLDRNINGTGRGKYGLVNNRKIAEIAGLAADAIRDQSNGLTISPGQRETVQIDAEISCAIRSLEYLGVIDWGPAGTASEFFVIKLRDRHAGPALAAYADNAAVHGDQEYAGEVLALAERAGVDSPFCKKPD